MMNKVHIKKTDNPEKLFEQLSKIENKYNTATDKVEEIDQIAAVMTAAPEEY